MCTHTRARARARTHIIILQITDWNSKFKSIDGETLERMNLITENDSDK